MLCVAARKVSASYATCEECVAGKQVWMRIKAYATRRVARCKDDFKGFIAKGERIAIFDTFVNWWRCRQAELREKLLNAALAEKVCVSRMHDDFGTGGFFELPVAADMVWMTMGVDDIFYLEVFLLAGCEDIVLIAAGINDHSLFGFITGHYITADPHHTNHHLFNAHTVS